MLKKRPRTGVSDLLSGSWVWRELLFSPGPSKEHSREFLLESSKGVGDTNEWLLNERRGPLGRISGVSKNRFNA